MNFLAFTNRINEKHFDIIWSSAQVILILLELIVIYFVSYFSNVGFELFKIIF